ncbi:MAG: hypothetical protein IMF11_03495 [Proteobacteria bacterium]|nr:hypothetical protein [Pseudomonadota bacterium]
MATGTWPPVTGTLTKSWPGGKIPLLVEVLQAGQKAGQELIESKMQMGKPVNGWSMITHLFDYNPDTFEVGAIDSSQWRIEDRAAAHVARAVAARVGLWGNHSYEAAGGLIYIRHDSPGPDKGSNWLRPLMETPVLSCVCTSRVQKPWTAPSCCRQSAVLWSMERTNHDDNSGSVCGDGNGDYLARSGTRNYKAEILRRCTGIPAHA